MSKELHDGLSLENSILIKDEKEPGFQILERLIQIFAIIIGSWSTVSLFCRSVNMDVNIIQVNTAIIICTGILFLLCLIPSYDLVKIFFFLLFYGLFFFSRLSKIRNGFFIIENLVIDRLVVCYKFSGFYFMANYSTVRADTTTLVIMFIIPVIALLTIAIVRNKLVNICSLVLFLPVSASFLLGNIPSEKYLIAYIVTVIYLTRSGFHYHRKADKAQFTLLHRINSRAAVWMSLLALFSFLIIRFIFPIDKYEDIKELDVMQTKVQKTFAQISIEDIVDTFDDLNIFADKSSVGGLRGGKLGKDGEIKYTGSKQLEVTAPYRSVASGIYLKGYVGSTYTGDSWDGPTKEDNKTYDRLLAGIPANQFTPVNQTSLFISKLINNANGKVYEPENIAEETVGGVMHLNYMYNFSMGTMKVKYEAANKKFIYAPYYTDFDIMKEIYYEKDLYAAPLVKQDSYSFKFYYDLALSDMGYADLLSLDLPLGYYPKYEKLYRNYVNSVYTKMPEKGLDRLKKEFSYKNIEKNAPSITDKMNYVMNYLWNHTQYTLAPGKLPDGKDFVEYFLYENKKGYCAHYASAATLMLRAMGVPARYVEGYVISDTQIPQTSQTKTQTVTNYTGYGKMSSDIVTADITVTDKNAHAWVEVYLDGCGWVPVDFTPGSNLVYNTSLVTDFAKAKTYIKDVPDPVTPTKEANKPTPVMNNKVNQANNSTQLDSDYSWLDYINISYIGKILSVLFKLLILALVILLIFILRKRRRIRKTRDNNKKVLFLFAEIEKTLSVCKRGLPYKNASLEDCEEYVRDCGPYVDSKIFTGCMDIIKKARFSNDTLTMAEVNKVETFYHNLYKDVYSDLPAIKRIYMKIILLM